MTNPDKKQTPSPVIVNRAKELRRKSTPQEQRLRNRQLYGLKFRRQHPLDRFIPDFCCYEQKLVMEIDGDSHAAPEQQRYDQARTAWLEQHGYRVIRFANCEVENNLESVLAVIAGACGFPQK